MPAMRFRRMGKSGLKLSALSLGTVGRALKGRRDFYARAYGIDFG